MLFRRARLAHARKWTNRKHKAAGRVDVTTFMGEEQEDEQEEARNDTERECGHSGTMTSTGRNDMDRWRLMKRGFHPKLKGIRAELMPDVDE